MTIVLSDQDTIANQFLVELRDKKAQADRPRFRRNLERLGEIMAYEVSRKLDYKLVSVETPLGRSKVKVIDDEPVLIAILRAGLPFYIGFQNFFDQSEAGFIGAYRLEGSEAPPDLKGKTERKLAIQLDYVATPPLGGKILILIDPMLATGRSVVDAMTALAKQGMPAHVHVASLVATPEGIAYLGAHAGLPFTLWTFAVDEKLNHNFYIVPGLGDAGDLSYGPKL